MAFVFTRYMLLSVAKRNDEDMRTLGELFYMMVEEMTDVTFHKSMLILQEARECKIVCVNRYCMNLLYAPYWGKQR